MPRPGQLEHVIFLALLAGGEVMDVAGGSRFGDLDRGTLDLVAETIDILAEVLQEHAVGGEEAGQSVGERKQEHLPGESEPIESADGPLNMGLVPG